jgi:hypothetical protein
VSFSSALHSLHSLARCRIRDEIIIIFISAVKRMADYPSRPFVRRLFFPYLDRSIKSRRYSSRTVHFKLRWGRDPFSASQQFRSQKNHLGIAGGGVYNDGALTLFACSQYGVRSIHCQSPQHITSRNGIVLQIDQDDGYRVPSGPTTTPR